MGLAPGTHLGGYHNTVHAPAARVTCLAKGTPGSAAMSRSRAALNPPSAPSTALEHVLADGKGSHVLALVLELVEGEAMADRIRR